MCIQYLQIEIFAIDLSKFNFKFIIFFLPSLLFFFFNDDYEKVSLSTKFPRVSSLRKHTPLFKDTRSQEILRMNRDSFQHLLIKLYLCTWNVSCAQNKRHDNDIHPTFDWTILFRKKKK